MSADSRRWCGGRGDRERVERAFADDHCRVVGYQHGGARYRTDPLQNATVRAVFRYFCLARPVMSRPMTPTTRD